MDTNGLMKSIETRDTLYRKLKDDQHNEKILYETKVYYIQK